MILPAPLQLLLMVVVLDLIYRAPFARRFLKYLPLPLLCYLTPMLMVAAGWLYPTAPGGGVILSRALPLALALLLIQIDIPAFLKVGRSALWALGASWLGLSIGLILGTTLFQNQLPEAAWKGTGMLSATWNGGSLNMIAVSELLQAPADFFAPLLLVDAVVAYGWMAGLIALSGRKGKSLRDAELFAANDHQSSNETAKRIKVPTVIILFSAVALAFVSFLLAQRMPENDFLSSTRSWHILWVTLLALILAATGKFDFRSSSASETGTFFLYWVLAYLGSQGDFTALKETPGWLWVGLSAALGQVLVLMFFARRKKIGWPLLATASQANMGGFVSAPIVAAMFHPALVPTALLLAIGCQALGTYTGWLIAQITRMLIT